MEKLAAVNKPLYSFLCQYDGDYKKLVENDSEDLPAPRLLEVKNTAHIMMINNDAGNRWVNGSLGIIEKIDEDSIWVKFENGNHCLVERERWENKDPDGNVVGWYEQFPMQLAYAITIHKSQGKTFDSICINICNGAWAHGQVYVALSRCKSLDGITIFRPIMNSDVIVDPVVTIFLNDGTITIENQPQYSIREILDIAVSKRKRIRMRYTNADNETAYRTVVRLSYIENDNSMFRGFYTNETHPRNFKFEKVSDIIIL